MNRLRIVLALLAPASLLVLASLFVSRYLLRDSCLDAGGVFDYAQLACRMDTQSLPVGRLVDPLLASSLVALSGCSAAMSLWLGRRRNNLTQ